LLHINFEVEGYGGWGTIMGILGKKKMKGDNSLDANPNGILIELWNFFLKVMCF
jgi:hypothetical protein